ncbi:MAG: hypothetical protein K2X47_07410 [Bdellovibrionales bacterium]|nr:hypothetical protein [Bdellovibrionales bacterium]
MPWGRTEREKWFKEQKIQRSYRAEVVNKITALGAKFDVHQYGGLSLDPDRYPLFILKSKVLIPQKGRS